MNWIKKLIGRRDSADALGLNRRAGDSHYRAYVGPPVDYDTIAAMTFNLLTTIGLRQHHKVLDIGCGSLRVGRLLIPYLNQGGYIGVEPNGWLIREGVRNEVGHDLVRKKMPTFVVADSLRGRGDVGQVDFAFAQSVFSHTGLDLMNRWLEEIFGALREDGVLLATYLVDERDSSEKGWIYPGCVRFRTLTMADAAAANRFKFVPLDWHHPRQKWAMFAKPGFDSEWFETHELSWNSCALRARAKSDAAPQEIG